MQYLSIDGIPVKLSRIAMGSTYLGTTVTEYTAFNLLDRFCELGGTVIDTARVYGQDSPGGPGLAELTIGTWLKSTGLRKSIVLASKGLHPDLAMHSRFTMQNLRRDFQQSLEALGTDCLDIWFFHRDDPTLPVGEIIDMLEEAVPYTQVRIVGASNWPAERISAANTYARDHHKRMLMVSEIQWSLAHSTPESWNDPTLVCMDEHEFFWYQNSGMPIFAFSAQAKGLFSKAIALGIDQLNHKVRARFLSECNRHRIDRVKEVSIKRSLGPAAIATSYIASHPLPAIAIVGCSTVEQLNESMQGADLVLSNEDRQFLLDKEAW